MGAIRGKRWALYAVMAFPIIAWVFGAGAVPYLSHLFSPVTPRTIAITVINLAVIAAAVWLRWGRSNNSFTPKPLRGSA
jgi:Na+/citrate or Na+/malate symporter